MSTSCTCRIASASRAGIGRALRRASESLTRLAASAGPGLFRLSRCCGRCHVQETGHEALSPATLFPLPPLFRARILKPERRSARSSQTASRHDQDPNGREELLVARYPETAQGHVAPTYNRLFDRAVKAENEAEDLFEIRARQLVQMIDRRHGGRSARRDELVPTCCSSARESRSRAEITKTGPGQGSSRSGIEHGRVRPRTLALMRY